MFYITVGFESTIANKDRLSNKFHKTHNKHYEKPTIKQAKQKLPN